MKNKKFQFELLTRRSNFYFFCFRVTNSKLKNKKLHFRLLTRWLNWYFFLFELPTRGWKIKKIDGFTFIFSLSSYEYEVDKLKQFLNYFIFKTTCSALFYYIFLYLACFFVSTYVIFIWVCWILIAYASSTTCLLTKLPHAGVYNYNGREIELFYMKWFNCG